MAVRRPWWLWAGTVSRKHVFEVIYLVWWLSDRVPARWPENDEALSALCAGYYGRRAPNQAQSGSRSLSPRPEPIRLASRFDTSQLGCQHANQPQDEQAVVQGPCPGRFQTHADLYGRGITGFARLLGH